MPFVLSFFLERESVPPLNAHSDSRSVYPAVKTHKRRGPRIPGQRGEEMASEDGENEGREKKESRLWAFLSPRFLTMLTRGHVLAAK